MTELEIEQSRREDLLAGAERFAAGAELPLRLVECRGFYHQPESTIHDLRFVPRYLVEDSAGNRIAVAYIDPEDEMPVYKWIGSTPTR